MKRLGIDIGGTKIKIGLFSGEKKLLGSRKLQTADVQNFPADLAEEIQALCAESNVKLTEISGCGVGIPGTVSEDGMTVVTAPNLQKLPSGFAAELSNKIKVPVRLLQDSRAAAWGEYFCGAGQGKKVLVCVTLGTGIGTGIVLNGEIYNGALGCAGELGHLPVKPNGRKCGCGKTGCLEKYAAGGGLGLSAEELLGPGKTAKDLFKASENGNEDAKVLLEEAVQMLGNGLTAIINLLSPDALLLSGGLSEQEAYIKPLIEYIRTHCYNAGTLPEIGLAKLGADAPLFGAAFLPMPAVVQPHKQLLSASIMCADALHMADAIAEMTEAGIDWLHCDIMDNHFVPNLMLPPEILNRYHEACTLPFDYHIMAEHPESILPGLSVRKGDFISVHAESTPHLERTVQMIHELGAKAAVALNPATPLSTLDEILPELDMVLLMTVNPGFAGQKLVPNALDKISRMHRILQERKLSHILLEVDGNCSFENVPKMAAAGADIFVVGTSSVFRKGLTVREGTEKLRELLMPL